MKAGRVDPDMMTRSRKMIVVGHYIAFNEIGTGELTGANTANAKSRKWFEPCTVEDNA